MSLSNSSGEYITAAGKASRPLAVTSAALKNGTAVRDVDYPTVRTALISSSPYTRPIVLDQVN